MKKLLLILLCVPLIFSCGEKEDKVLKLEEKIAYELSQEIEVNDLFLNFEFGDTEKEVNKKLRELVKKDKISIDNIGRYSYEFNNPIKKGIATFSFDYYQDKLYKLSLTVDPKNRYDMDFSLKEDINTDVSLVFFKIMELYCEKFGTPLRTDNVIFKEEIAYSNLHWVKGNRLIEISVFVDVTIDYIDLNIQSLVENENNKQKIDLKENMKNDL
jgi:hypothetical protein